jgi:hypothetical protein
MPPKTINAPKQPTPMTIQTTGEVRFAGLAPGGDGAPGTGGGAGACHTASGRRQEGHAVAPSATSAPQCVQ